MMSGQTQLSLPRVIALFSISDLFKPSGDFRMGTKQETTLITTGSISLPILIANSPIAQQALLATDTASFTD
jgi:hypothetical protein